MAPPIRITTTEIEEMYKVLKNDKALGPENLPSNLIKYCITKLYANLAKLFQSFIDGMHKKGKRNNFRVIVVTSSVS